METLFAIFSGIAAVLGFLFGIPIIGFFLQLAFLMAIVWVVYRYTPTFIRKRTVPYLSAMTRGARRLFVRMIADPDMLHRPGDAKPQIVYKEIRVTRSLRSNLFLRMRWAALGALTLLIIQNREVVAPWIPSILG